MMDFKERLEELLKGATPENAATKLIQIQFVMLDEIISNSEEYQLLDKDGKAAFIKDAAGYVAEFVNGVCALKK